MADWTAPARCRCEKIRYPDEAAAEAAIARRRAEPDDVGRADWRPYKCPGSSAWHLATRGFHPRALQSLARVCAWHIDSLGVISWDGLLVELGLTVPDGYWSNKGKRVGHILRAFAELGLVTLDEPRNGYITTTDRAGLRRKDSQ